MTDVLSLMGEMQGLHGRRCRAYAAWRECFGKALRGAATTGEYEVVALATTQEFQAVSARIREVQRLARAAAAGDATAPSTESAAAVKPAPAAKTLPARHRLRLLKSLDRAIDDVQGLERRQYDAEVERQRATAVHARRPVTHDVDCACVGACGGHLPDAMRVGRGLASSLDEGDRPGATPAIALSDDDAVDDVPSGDSAAKNKATKHADPQRAPRVESEGAAAAADEPHSHGHCHHHCHAEDATGDASRDNGCAAFGKSTTALRATASDAAAAVQAAMDELQAEISAIRAGDYDE